MPSLNLYTLWLLFLNIRAMTLLIGATKDDQLMKATFATHNQESIEKSLDTLKKCEDVSEDSIQFAQINGLGDHLSMFLVQNNQKVLKLLPCGTISDVLPWLAR